MSRIRSISHLNTHDIGWRAFFLKRSRIEIGSELFFRSWFYVEWLTRSSWSGGGLKLATSLRWSSMSMIFRVESPVRVEVSGVRGTTEERYHSTTISDLVSETHLNFQSSKELSSYQVLHPTSRLSLLPSGMTSQRGVNDLVGYKTPWLIPEQILVKWDLRWYLVYHRCLLDRYWGRRYDVLLSWADWKSKVYGDGGERCVERERRMDLNRSF